MNPLPATGVLLMIFLAGAAGFEQAGRSPGPDPATLAAFDDLQRTIAGLARSTPLAPGQRTSLARKIDAARSAYERGGTSASANVLTAYLNETQALRRGSVAGVADRLFNEGWDLRLAVRAQASRGSPEPPADAEAAIAVGESDISHVAARITFGVPRLSTAEAGGEVWTELAAPGLSARFGQTGFPSVPIFHRLVAVPHGADIALAATPIAGGTLRMNLYPVQPEPDMQAPTPDDFLTELPPDSVFANKPFTKDARAYAIDAPYPSEICRVQRLGAARDLELAEIACAAAQYNPVSDELTYFTAIDVAVRFAGGDEYFVTAASTNPFDSASAIISGSVLNKEAVTRHVGPDPARRICYGEELLILTHPLFRPSADSLADWKQSRGMPTRVVEVNDGAGPGPDTTTEIKHLISHDYFSCIVRPSYVLLMGGVELVPTFSFQRVGSSDPSDVIPSDFFYSTITTLEGDIAETTLALGVGRIHAETQAQATTFVNKIKQYEASPPADAAFYQAAIASQFQCCRTNVPGKDGLDTRAFIEVVEGVRNRLSLYAPVQRIYTETVEADYHGDPQPRAYYGGALLPADLGQGSGFMWNGSKADIVGAINDGRFLMVHLDHGGPTGWVNPPFEGADAWKLTNGPRLPFVLSYNCSSGYPDAPGNDYLFTKPMLRNPNGGAIGVIAPTRSTNAWGNVMIMGALDAAFPNMDVSFGSATPKRRLGDMLTQARLYMLNKNGINDSVINHLWMYLLFGDPSLELQTGPPAVLPIHATIVVTSNAVKVSYAVEGATITALQPTRAGLAPIGRGVVRDGVATLDYVVDPIDGLPLLLTAHTEDGVAMLQAR